MNADNGGDCCIVLALGCPIENLTSTLEEEEITTFKSREIKRRDVKDRATLWGFHQQLTYRFEYEGDIKSPEHALVKP